MVWVMDVNVRREDFVGRGGEDVVKSSVKRSVAGYW